MINSSIKKKRKIEKEEKEEKEALEIVNLKDGLKKHQETIDLQKKEIDNVKMKVSNLTENSLKSKNYEKKSKIIFGILFVAILGSFVFKLLYNDQKKKSLKRKKSLKQKKRARLRLRT